MRALVPRYPFTATSPKAGDISWYPDFQFPKAALLLEPLALPTPSPLRSYSRRASREPGRSTFAKSPDVQLRSLFPLALTHFAIPFLTRRIYLLRRDRPPNRGVFAAC